MGVDFLKKKNDNYERRRRLLLEREFRQGGLFQGCPPEQLTYTRARLSGQSVPRAGELLWGRFGTQDGLLLQQSGHDVAQIPASIVPALAEEAGTSEEVIAEVMSIDSERGRVDLRISTARNLRCPRKPRSST